MEIRQKIFRFLLESPTGYIHLRKADLSEFDPDETRFRVWVVEKFATQFSDEEFIDLSLLRTCKQVYAEAKDLFWKHNTMRFTLTGNPFQSNLFDGRSIQHVHLGCEMTWDKTPRQQEILMERAGELLDNFKDLSINGGALKKVMLTMGSGWFGPQFTYQHYFEMIDNPRAENLSENHEHLEEFALREYGSVARFMEKEKEAIEDFIDTIGISGPRFAPHVEKKLLLRLDLPGLAGAIRRDDLEKEAEICLKIGDLIEEMYANFGGEIWQDENLLLWKDGVELAELPLRGNTREGLLGGEDG